MSIYILRSIVYKWSSILIRIHYKHSIAQESSLLLLYRNISSNITTMSVPAIAIIGGGPSGLALARLLEVNKIDYVVYERDATSSVEGQGGSLDIHGKTGQVVLKEAGLFDEFKKYARWDATKTLIQDKNGTTHLTFGEEQDSPEIDRASLRKILLESIPPSKIKWNHAVGSVEKLDSGNFSINFKNGISVAGFKLVVGADGAWSKARHLVSSTRVR